KRPLQPLRQPERHEVVTHVSGTIRYLCVRSGHISPGAARGIRTPDPIITNDVLYRLSYCGINDLAETGLSCPCPQTTSGIAGILARASGYSMIWAVR